VAIAVGYLMPISRITTSRSKYAGSVHNITTNCMRSVVVTVDRSSRLPGVNRVFVGGVDSRYLDYGKMDDNVDRIPNIAPVSADFRAGVG